MLCNYIEEVAMSDSTYLNNGLENKTKFLMHEDMAYEYENYEPILKKYLLSEPKEHQKAGIAWTIYRETTPKNGCAGGFIMDEPGM